MSRERNITAKNITLNSSGRDLPVVIDLLPPGKAIEGLDGRGWVNPGNSILIDRFNKTGLQLPVDINHSCEHQGMFGGDSPAQGWVYELFEEDGFLRGRVRWTDEARNSVATESYKYISPAFAVNKNGTEIKRLTSVGLVNRPNFPELSALNHQKTNDQVYGGEMNKLLQALGLKPGANEEEAVAALNSIKEEINNLKVAVNSDDQKTDVIPRADYQLAINRAEKAEAAIVQKQREDFEIALNDALGDAVKDGKIAPSSREFYQKTIRSTDDLSDFNSFINSAPPVLENQRIPEGRADSGKTELNAEEAEIARQFGYSVEEAANIFGKKEMKQ